MRGFKSKIDKMSKDTRNPSENNPILLEFGLYLVASQASVIDTRTQNIDGWNAELAKFDSMSDTRTRHLLMDGMPS